MKTSLKNIRPAALSNLDAILELSGQLGYPGETEDLKFRLEYLLSHDDHEVFVYEHERQVIGWLHVFKAVRVESTPFAEIGGLIVDQKYRGSGVGSLLIKVAEEWAQHMGVKKIRVRSNIIREDAKKFYLARNFAVSKVQNIFDKKLNIPEL